LESVSIRLKSSINAITASDTDGLFVGEAKEGDVLVFSLLGYQDTEERVGSSSSLNIILQSDLSELDEVVVVGFGTQKKGNLTGSVSIIESGQLERRPTVSTSAALQGLAPGVTVTTQTGSPGGDGGQIRIRGISSFGGSDSSPLVIIDGV